MKGYKVGFGTILKIGFNLQNFSETESLNYETCFLIFRELKKKLHQTELEKIQHNL